MSLIPFIISPHKQITKFIREQNERPKGHLNFWRSTIRMLFRTKWD
jgi:hypothetical protein